MKQLSQEYVKNLMKIQKELNISTDEIIDMLARYVVDLCLSEASDSYIAYLNERIDHYMCKEG